VVANNRDLKVEFKGDASDLKRAANDSEKAMGGVGKAASGSGGLLSKLTPVIDPISLVTQGLSFLANAGMDFAQAAIDDSKSAAALDGVLRKVTGATNDQIKAQEDWISTLSLHVGIVDDELRPAYARLVAATGDTAKAQADLKLALDIAAGTGKDFNSVSDAMVKAHNGNVGALGRLGVAVKDVNGKLLPLPVILQNAKDKYSGLAEKVADQDPLNKMKIAWGEIQEQLGSVIVPVLQKVTDMFTEKLWPAMQKIWDMTDKQLSPVIRDQLKPALDSFKKALDELNRALAPLTGGMSLWTILLLPLRVGIQLLTNALQILTVGLRVATAVVHGIGAAFSWLAGILMKGVMGALSAVMGGFRMVGEVAQSVAGFIAKVWSNMAAGLAKLVEPIKAVWDSLFGWIKRTWNSTVGKLSFHIPGTSIGFDVPDIGRAAPGGTSMPSVINVNLPSGTDGHAIVSALRTYGVRVGGLDLAVNATR
jgi:hypothetical protein